MSWRVKGGRNGEDMVRTFFRCTAGLLESQTFQGMTTVPKQLFPTLHSIPHIETVGLSGGFLHLAAIELES